MCDGGTLPGPHMVEGTGELPGVSFIRALTLVIKLHPHDLIASQSPSPQIPSHLGLGFQHMNLGGTHQDSVSSIR